MYPLLISGGLGTALAVALLIFPEPPWYFFGPFLGTVVFVPTFILLSRLISAKIQPFFEQAQQQAQSGNVPQAVQTFEKALAYKRWQLFLQAQVNTQVGILKYAAGDEREAAEFLSKGYPRISDGHLVLGAILYRQKKLDEARKALETGIRYNKKSPILYNFLAWMLHKEGQVDAAIEVLNKVPKALKDDEDTKDNLDRLRNGKKLNMKPFGQFWYMLKFETPPGMGHTKPFRKGFRQAPKNPKKGKRRKR